VNTAKLTKPSKQS